MAVQCGFYSTPNKSLHHSIKVAGGAKRYCRPPTLEQRLQADKQGLWINPHTGAFARRRTQEDMDAELRRNQDRLFAQQFGATAAQLGSGYDPGDPYLASLSYGIVGGPSQDRTYLRPDQIQALLAAKGAGAGLASSEMPSRSAGSAGAFPRLGPGGGSSAPAPFSEEFGLAPSGGAGAALSEVPPLAIVAVAVAALFLLR